MGTMSTMGTKSTKNIEEKLSLITEDTWIISDTHFGHKNILEFEPCRLNPMRIDGYDAHEHEEWIIENWNNTVKPGDTVLHLGDFAFTPGYYTKEYNKAYETKFKNVDIKRFKSKLKLYKSSPLNSLKKLMEINISEDMKRSNKGDKNDKGDKSNKEQFRALVSNNIPESDYYIRYKDLLNGTIILVLGNHDPKPGDNKLKGIEVIDGFYWTQPGIINKVLNPDPMFSGFIKTFRNKKYLFSHYEIHTTDKYDKENIKIKPRIDALRTIFEANDCDYNVHGHIHSKASCTSYSKNVSFERIGFAPIRLKEIL